MEFVKFDRPEEPIEIILEFLFELYLFKLYRTLKVNSATRSRGFVGRDVCLDDLVDGRSSSRFSFVILFTNVCIFFCQPKKNVSKISGGGVF